MEKKPITGLTYGEQKTDWKIEGGKSLIERLQKLPVINISTLRRYSQKEYPRHETSCTKFAPINAFANIFSYDFSWDEINQIEDLSINNGFQIGGAWTRGQGVDIVRKRWNTTFPNKSVDTFVTDTLGKEFDIYMNRGYTAVVSIRIGMDFLKDIAQDGDVDGPNFGYDYGHATSIRLLNNGQYQFIDSAFPKKTGIYTITRPILETMVKNGNMQPKCHLILPHNIIPMIAQDVPKGQRFSDAVERMIKEGLTTETDKFRPQAQVTRAEIAVFLKRLYDKLQSDRH